MAAPAKRSWATTAEVCAAGEISDSTAMKWAARAVLPAYKTGSFGRRGRSARWPRHAPAQAAWVMEQLRQGFSFEEIKEALEQGAFQVRDPDREDTP